jgi:hypothetical protein
VTASPPGDQADIELLDTLDSDISDRPGLLRPIPAELVERARDLIRGVEVDLEASLMIDRRESP